MKFSMRIAPLVLLVGICLQLSCAAPISNTPIDTVSDVEEFDFAGSASGEENLYTGTLIDTDTETVSDDEHREADEASFYSNTEIDAEAEPEEVEEPESSDLKETDDDIVTDTEEADDDDVVTFYEDFVDDE